MSAALYRLYVAALVFVMAVVPLTWGIVDTLAQPRIAAALNTTAGVRIVGAAAFGLLCLLAYLGTQRGPIVSRPFVVSILIASGKPRAKALRPIFRRSAGILVAITTYVGGLILTSLYVAAEISSWHLVMVLVGVLVFGLLLARSWLWGQTLAGHGPQTGIGAVFGSTSTLLNALFGPTVVAQSQRWHAAWAAFYVGDSTGAFALYHPVPRTGRYRTAVTPATVPAWWRTLRMDAVSATRLPGHLVFTGIGTSIGCALLLAGARYGESVTQSIGASGLLGAAGALAIYFAMGPITTRFKYVVNLHRSPALLGYSTRTLAAMHSAFPLLTVVLCAGATLVVWRIIFSSLGTAPLSLICVLILLIGLRWYNSAKRDLPIVLLTPLDSPVGDLSSLNVLLWQAQSPLLAGLVGALAAITSL